MLRDLHNHALFTPALYPVASPADNTPLVTEIIDVYAAYGASMEAQNLEFCILTGALPDAGATWTTLVEHGDDLALADAAAVPDNELLGTEALASFNQGDDNKAFKIGYRGGRRYVRLTITPAGNASASLLAVVAVQTRS